MNLIEKKVNALMHKSAWLKLMKKSSEKKTYSYNVSEENKAYITVSESGIIEEASGLNLICWFNVDEDINQKFIGKHISELQEYLNEYVVNRESMKSFDSIVKKYKI